MNCAHVYQAINLVSAEIALLGVPKPHTNTEYNYQYRSIDDVLARLAPILAKHKLCVLPRVLERTAAERGSDQDLLIAVTLKVAFDLASAQDGSLHIIQAYGEALDVGDKATSKAMSSAYKAAMVQTFCIPIAGSPDADRDSHRLKAIPFTEPVEGWAHWSQGIIETIGICESEEALDRTQNTHRGSLSSLKREQPDFYRSIGEAFRGRRAALRAPASPDREDAQTAEVAEKEALQTQRTVRQRRPSRVLAGA